jgi:hypothetical protein
MFLKKTKMNLNKFTKAELISKLNKVKTDVNKKEGNPNLHILKSYFQNI